MNTRIIQPGERDSLGDTSVHDIHAPHGSARIVEQPFILVCKVRVEAHARVLALERVEQRLDHGGCVGVGGRVNVGRLEVGEGAEDGGVE